ncbi:hypothetical protein C7E13_05450 [Stenotrophomonas maltophilia]|nr:hypothetical protein C7E13_05450 [Stenotrophomonas maltophilia]
MEMKEKMREREALSPTGFYDQYYADSGLDQETVVELLEHVADELRLPSGKLVLEIDFRRNCRLVKLMAGTRGMEF